MVYYNYINILIRLPGDSPCRRAGKKGFPMPLSFLDELNDIWKMVRDSFRKELSNTVTDLFLGDLSVTGIEDDTTIILTGDSVIKMRTVNLKYREEIEKRFPISSDTRSRCALSASPPATRSHDRKATRSMSA